MTILGPMPALKPQGGVRRDDVLPTGVINPDGSVTPAQPGGYQGGEWASPLSALGLNAPYFQGQSVGIDNFLSYLSDPLGAFTLIPCAGLGVGGGNRDSLARGRGPFFW